MKAIFVNGDKSRPQCSIFEAGELSVGALSLSSKMDLDYFPVSGDEPIPPGYDIAIFNFHPATLRMSPQNILNSAPLRVLLSFERATYWDPWYIPNGWTNNLKELFHYSAVPDPELVTDDPSVIKLPRVVLRSDLPDRPINMDAPVITTFGLTPRTTGPSSKLLAAIAGLMSKEFGAGTLRLHYPRGSHVPDFWREELDRDISAAQAAFPKIDITISSDYKSKPDLIAFLHESDLNAFFYSSERDLANGGVANIPSAIDFGLGSRRPLALSNSECARHYLRYLTPYPEWSLKDSLEKSQPIVKKMAELWSPEAFCAAFDSFLERC